LADFRRCPLLYRKKKLGVIEDQDRPAYLVGRALHTLALEGREAFAEQYAVEGPVNPKTGQPYGSNTKAFARWAAEQGRPVLTLEQFDLIEQMAESVEQHELAEELLSDGIPEAVVRADYCGLPCQARMDWFDPRAGLVEFLGEWTCKRLLVVPVFRAGIAASNLQAEQDLRRPATCGSGRALPRQVGNHAGAEAPAARRGSRPTSRPMPGAGATCIRWRSTRRCSRR